MRRCCERSSTAPLSQDGGWFDRRRPARRQMDDSHLAFPRKGDEANRRAQEGAFGCVAEDAHADPAKPGGTRTGREDCLPRCPTESGILTDGARRVDERTPHADVQMDGAPRGCAETRTRTAALPKRKSSRLIHPSLHPHPFLQCRPLGALSPPSRNRINFRCLIVWQIFSRTSNGLTP